MTSVVEPGTGRVLAWKDVIPLGYGYTAGTAGEAFLRGLKEGRILASKCPTCGDVRLPPRAYCLQCYSRTRVDVEILHFGRVEALSTAHLGEGGRKLEAAQRTTFGFVEFEGVSGGILHKVLGARVGDPVRPIFARPEERKGSILDLAGFASARVRSRNR